MKTFLQFLREALDIKYTLPENKETQLYDFYMSTTLTSEDDHLQSEIDYVKGKLYPKLKNELLEALFFSICSEVRHILDVQSHEEIETKILDNFPYYSKLKANDIFISWWEKLGDKSSIGDYELSRKEYSKSNNIDRITSYTAALESTDDKRFVELSKFFFDIKNFGWNQEYGGTPWVKICDGWLKLNAAKSIPDLMIQIDHVYDLQHNTDSVFNKLMTYYNDKTKYGWLKNALNYKAHIRDPYQLMDKVSYEMKRLAQHVFKKSTDETEETFEPKKDKLDKETDESYWRSDKAKKEFTKGRVKTLENGSLSVDGSVEFEKYKFSELPLNFEVVDGNFSVFRGPLKSLKGFPKFVSRDVQILGTEVNSLEGLPKRIKGHFVFMPSKNAGRNLTKDDIPKDTVIDGDIRFLDYPSPSGQ